MRAVPDSPPPRMVFALALEYARRGYFIRPVSWDGSEDGHELAWLQYPAGFPLAYYVSAETGAAGRRWLADDLAREDWFAWWTCLGPECFVEDADGNLPVCLCDTGDVNWTWSFYAYGTDETALDALSNPNAALGIEGCSSACDCASTGGGTTPVVPVAPVSPIAPVSPVNPGNPGNPVPGSPPAAPGNGNPTPSGSLGGGGGGGGGGSGKPPKKRDPKPQKIGPTITLEALLTDPEGCVYGAEAIEHRWTIGLKLSDGADVADELYSVHIRVLGTTIYSGILAPGGTASVDYVRTLEPDGPSLLAIGSGAAFGAGPACVTGTVDLKLAGICGASSSDPSSSSSDGGSSVSSSVASSFPPTSAPLTSYILGFSSVDPAGACVVGGGDSYYGDEASLGVGVALHTDSEGGSPAPNGYYSREGLWYQVTGGEIVASGSCE